MFGIGGRTPTSASGFSMILFSIYDTKAEIYFPPLVAATVGEALRIFTDLLTTEGSKMAKHPGDYRLYKIGEFHTDSGVVVPLDAGIQLIEEGLLLVKEA